MLLSKAELSDPPNPNPSPNPSPQHPEPNDTDNLKIHYFFLFSLTSIQSICAAGRLRLVFSDGNLKPEANNPEITDRLDPSGFPN
ncbi:hypothetical protein NHX12_026126 [Muraenolepis orangiensis]|uniref:Uncharacterized protein n=1 Tax=Muraenolepis orangiensis TaxID=630683 RepID=A0A9Q0EJS2_9TELE|nr:hypothetical protein NHX12_026126 [Muraenolepis orangiensis]